LANLPFDRNALLAQLDASDRARLNGSAQLVDFDINQLMYEVDERIEDIWFPISGMISVVTDMRDGGSVEVTASGREGIIGFEGYLGSKVSKRKQMGQVKGQAIVMSLKSSKSIFCQGKGLKALLLFIHAQIVETSQGAACNRVHSAEERLARWLLATRDRVGSNHLTLTHEFLSMMLGARRSTVSLAAAKFQAAGLIEYRRGNIHITDESRLTDAACECYTIIRQALFQ
jgi:CRP-like cAMP-binding protein